MLHHIHYIHYRVRMATNYGMLDPHLPPFHFAGVFVQFIKSGFPLFPMHMNRKKVREC